MVSYPLPDQKGRAIALFWVSHWQFILIMVSALTTKLGYLQSRGWNRIFHLVWFELPHQGRDRDRWYMYVLAFRNIF